MNRGAGSVLNAEAGSVLNAGVGSVLNAEADSVLNAETGSVLNAGAGSVLKRVEQSQQIPNENFPDGSESALKNLKWNETLMLF